MLYRFAADASRDVATRSLALSSLPADSDRPDNQELLRWMSDEKDRRFGGEVVRLLVARDSESASEAIAEIAADSSNHDQVRADAVIRDSAARSAAGVPTTPAPAQAPARRSPRSGCS